MSQFDEVLESPEWAFAFAAALGEQLGDDRILTVGTARASVADVVGDDPVRSVTLRFTTANGHRGSITLVAVATFAQTLEEVAADDTVATPCATAFDAAIRMVGEQAVVEVRPGSALEIDVASSDDPVDGDDVDTAVFPLLDGGEVLAAVVLSIGANADETLTEPEPEPVPGDPANGVAPNPSEAPNAGAGPSYVLADVEMGVTAELGRCRMTMRDLLSITPGAVIDLDRPAGAPVDVLVNGTLIARGEVVVVDEEFGIRISELVPQPVR